MTVLMQATVCMLFAERLISSHYKSSSCMLGTSFSSSFFYFFIFFSDTPFMLTPISNFTLQKGLMCIIQAPYIDQQSTICMVQNLFCKNPRSAINLSCQILDFVLFPLPDHTVFAIIGGAGGGALLLVVITGVLLCALVIRKVRHTATKSQSKLYTLWVFFSHLFYQLMYKDQL